MNQRFQISLKALMVVTVVAAVISAQLYYARKAEIERAILVLRYWKKQEAKMESDTADCVPLRLIDEVRNEARAAEKRVKELRGY